MVLFFIEMYPSDSPMCWSGCIQGDTAENQLNYKEAGQGSMSLKTALIKIYFPAHTNLYFP